ncbi:MAG: MFS transporter [Planctomycetes bacterium]|nr:MFS transporter [Planctomycetota bacterium]
MQRAAAPGSAPSSGDAGGWRQLASLTVLVSALGYFVDIYDIVLFNVVRVPSCRELGIDDARALTLLDWQMAGMLLGGFAWGLLGDRIGRKAVLFGSILTYSLANLANAAVGLPGVPGDPYTQYALLRVVAGFGLAGELGAAITLVSETTHPRWRGYATALVAAIGIAGAAAAVAVAKLTDWRTAYVVGGLLGLALLALRLRVLESALFADVVASGVARGSLRLLFSERRRVARLLWCTVIGLPLWYMVGMVAFRADKLGEAMGAAERADPAFATLACYLGLIVGDLAAGCLSQWLRSRRRAVVLFLAAAAAICVVILTRTAPSPALLYGGAAALGVACGYWAVFVTIAAEQFGTNLRSTVTGIVPNLVRGAVPLWSWLIASAAPAVGLVPATLGIGLAVLALALLAVLLLRETYAVPLDYIER